MDFILLNNFSEANLIIDSNLTILYFNNEFCESFGYNHKDLINHSISKLIVNKESFNTLNSFIEKDKKIRFEDNIYLSIQLENKSIQGVQLCINKISDDDDFYRLSLTPTEDFDKINQKNKENVDVYYSLISHNEDHIFQLDAHKEIIYINHVAPGLIKEEVIGTSVLNYLPSEESKKVVEEALDSSIQTKKPTQYQVDFDSPNGKIYYNTFVTPIIENDQVVKLNLITRNVTDQYYYQQALVQRNHFTEKLSQNTQHGVYIFNIKKSKNIYSNNRCEEILGFKRNEFRNMANSQFLDLIHKDDKNKIIRHWQRLLESNDTTTSFEVDYRFKTKENKWKWLRSRDSGFEFDKHGNLESILGSFMDITDIINLKKSEKELIQKNQEIEDFVYSASHDIKSPINNVAKLIDFTISNGEPSGRYMEVINKAVQRLNHLVIDVLDFKNSDEIIEFEEVDINSLLGDVRDDLKTETLESKAKISYTTFPKIVANYFGLYRVFQNLMNNAFKFRNKSNELTINIELENKDDFWVFSFTDNGIGIQEDKLDYVFEPFTKLHNQSEYSGSGLGLANCKKIIQQLGGVIKAEGNKTGGTTFSFSISKKLQIIKKGDDKIDTSSSKI
ncbi:ATP-binding protein [Flammeovirga pacifica]|uniref:histidine kinase n=1 Tax=Flammeovirga pacifica TaxID=915059 RepID=A0A1S1YV28_FLAPC|nr:ATP-binding protein [Flammeovirga pacifica]OHX64871.1 hypothetical protein NH26_00195 [Flammeovirga pacifica]